MHCTLYFFTTECTCIQVSLRSTSSTQRRPMSGQVKDHYSRVSKSMSQRAVLKIKQPLTRLAKNVVPVKSFHLIIH